jgi:hypothetical protein
LTKILQRPDMDAGFVAQADRSHQCALERFQCLLPIGFSFL